MNEMPHAEFCDKSAKLIQEFKMDWPILVEGNCSERISLATKNRWRRNPWHLDVCLRTEGSYLTFGITACILEHYWRVWLKSRDCGYLSLGKSGTWYSKGEPPAEHIIAHSDDYRECLLDAVRAILEDEL